MSLLRSLLVLSFLIISCEFFAQEEFMVYGKTPSNTDSITISLFNSENGKLIETKTMPKGRQYRFYLTYQEKYRLEYSWPDHIPITVTLSTELPESVPACCFLPMEINLHLQKVQNNYKDSIVDGSIIDIRYENSLKNFNYDFDIDYLVEEKLVQAEINRQKAIIKSKEEKLANDSLAVEQEYYSFINCGNKAFLVKDYTKAKDCFLKALEIKPGRLYPKYKLEDIKTEQLLGAAKRPSPKDTLAKVDTVKPVAPKPKPKKVYKRMTDEEIERKLMGDIAKLIMSSEEDEEVAQERMSFLNDILDNDSVPVAIPEEEKAEPVVATKTGPIEEPKIEAPKKDTVASIEPEPEIKTIPKDTIANIEPEPKPETDVVSEDTITNEDPIIEDVIEKPLPKKNVSYIEKVPLGTKSTLESIEKDRQEELLQKYVNEKTVEVEKDDFKTITYVYMRNNGKVNVYMKVEHNWGATFYFINNYPYPNENITKAYFESATKVRK